MVKLLTEKTAKVISRKYLYKNTEEEQNHFQHMKQLGFNFKSKKVLPNGIQITYVKYTKMPNWCE